MIHGRRSCPGDLVGKSLVKWEEMVRMRGKKKLEKEKRRQHQVGGKSSRVKKEQMEWGIFIKRIN